MSEQPEKYNNVVPIEGAKRESMADLENGFTMLADQLIESLCLIDLSGCEFRLAMAIIRKTYGYKKKSDFISNSQLAEMTNIDVKRISKLIRSLIERRVINARKSGYLKELGVNKKTSEWLNGDQIPKKNPVKQIDQKGEMLDQKGEMLDQKGEMLDQNDPHNIDIELQIQNIHMDDSVESSEPVTQKAKPTAKVKTADPIEQDFNDLWAIKPNREGGNPKNKALSAYRARRLEGHTHEEIFQGLIRYVRYMTDKGDIGTSYVQQMSTFLGKGKGFQEEWRVSNVAGSPAKRNQQVSAEVEARRARYRKPEAANGQPGSGGNVIEGEYSEVMGCDGRTLR